MGFCRLKPLTETKKSDKHVEASAYGHSDRGSTPLASTTLIFKVVARYFESNYNMGCNILIEVRRVRISTEVF